MDAFTILELTHQERHALEFDGVTMYLDDGENDVVLLNAQGYYFHPYCNWGRPN